MKDKKELSMTAKILAGVLAVLLVFGSVAGVLIALVG